MVVRVRDGGTYEIPRRLVSFGALVALLPFWGFGVAYLYERGFAEALQIDHGQIAITSGAVAAASLQFLRGAVVIVLVMATATFGFERLQFRSREVMYLYLVGEALVVAAGAYVIANGLSLESTVTAAVALLVAAPLLALIIYASGPGEGFMARTRTAIDNPEGASILTPVFRLIGSGYFPIAVAAVVLAASAYWLGRHDARTQTSFQTLASDRRLVVLRVYGDRLVAARVLSGGRLASRRLVFRVGEEPADAFIRSKVGPLHP
jgi:hypothetical protein